MGRLMDSMRSVMRARKATGALAEMDVLDQAGGTAAAEQLMEQIVGGAEIDLVAPNDRGLIQQIASTHGAELRELGGEIGHLLRVPKIDR